ncbi:putative monooxygenase [Streptomyces sp. NBRC 110611]|uniref:FAD-dependent monooxygenase n=1 Tax=Streptomyces sp. NBRC 110611 TaxID=1621259 RepID=UPI000857782F|nr:FAD-dependent monooxygenase [Streptomyces sp. NBRC 110611]GAU65054.1 putative monooxygenase [Streptomyces sp. NBRC 110611]
MGFNNVKDARPTAADALPTAIDARPTTVDVLIAGAGPTGLALGIDLARRGVRALIVERQDRLSPGARGTGLQPRTQEVYDDLGVLDVIRANGGSYPEMALWEDGRIVSSRQMIEQVAPTPSTPYASALMVPQWRNLELLHERLRELGGSVLFGAELTSFDQDADTVRVRLARADGSACTIEARYLVAADGGRSTVRKGLGVGMNGTALQQGAVVLADARVDGLDRDHWHMWRPGSDSARTFAAMLPLAHTDLFQCMVAAPSDEPDISPEAVRALLSSHTHLTPEQIREVVWSSVFRPKAGMADRFRVGRVFLAGDAAHIHSPAGGQGLNTSVQDAYNLGWKLGQVLRYGAPDALLDSYEAERRPIARRILDTSTRLHHSGSMRRGRDLHQLDIGYPDSPLTRELRTDELPEGALRAGDRAPDAPCHTADGKPTRLFDAFRGPHFTLLVLHGTDAEAEAETGTDIHTTDPDLLRLVRVGGPSPDLIDTDGHLRDAYGPGSAVLLVRPDGYVAMAAPATGATEQVAAALSTYLGTSAGAAARHWTSTALDKHGTGDVRHWNTAEPRNRR